MPLFSNTSTRRSSWLFDICMHGYSTAAIRTTELGEGSPEIADLYLSYGKALLENAVAQSSVLGKNQPEGEGEEAEGSGEPPTVSAPAL